MKRFIKGFAKLVAVISAIAAIAACIAFICERIEEIKNKGIELAHKPYGIYEHYIKRPLDCFLSTGALIVFSPILLVLTVIGAVEMKGNPFFVQERPGRIDPKTGKERIFKLIKFRTMTNVKDENGNLLPDEQRLNRYGEWLRSTSLDELSELINIINGDLSIVGPRPQLVRDMVFMSKKQRKRHCVRQGLTGLAQCNGRNGISWDDKLNYDTDYVDNGITFLGDLKIIMLTLIKVIKRDGITEENEATATDYGDYLLKNGIVSKKEYEEYQKQAKDIIMKKR